MNIADIKKKNAEIGEFFFSPETLKFFSSKIFEEVLPGGYFITRETPPNEWPRFTVRKAEPGGQITTVSDFCEYSNHLDAYRAAKGIV